MESIERREPQGTSEDREEGTPEGRLMNEEPAPDERDDSPQGDIGAPEEGGADSAADAAREGG